MLPPVAKQTWTAMGVLVNVMGQGLVFSYPSSLLPALRAEDSPIKIDLKGGSLLASSVGFSSMIGFMLSSLFMDFYGRRTTHIIMMIPGFIGWTMTYFANSFALLMWGRTLCGITVGGTVTLGAIIIGEYSSPENRGIFLNLKTSAICVGTTAMHILSNYFEWRTIALLALIPMGIAFVSVLTWSESPAWLAGKNRYKSSESAFFSLRGSNERAVREFEAMIRAQKTRVANVNPNASAMERVVHYLKKMVKKDFIKPLTLISVAYILMEASGRHTFPAYALEIVGAVEGGTASHAFFYTLCIDVITISSTGVSSILVKVMNRRTLLFSSAICSAIILLFMSSYLILASYGVVASDRSWIPLSLLVLYFIFVNMGCTPVPIGLLGELFPLDHRAFGIAVAGLVTSGVMMLGLQFTPYLMEMIKIEGTFLIIAACIIFPTFYLYYALPETKDRTLQEIEDYFNHGRFLDDSYKDNELEETKMEMLRHNIHNRETFVG